MYDVYKYACIFTCVCTLTGFPIANTFCPTSKSAETPTGIGLNLSFGASIRSTATSLSWSKPTTFASYVV